MQFGLKKNQSDLPTGRLKMYRIPPTEVISLEEFENFAEERLKVLREVEMLGIRNKKDSDEYSRKMRSALKKKFLKCTYSTITGEKDDEKSLLNESRRDDISHFILRLAYCKSAELRRWFVTQEVDLFKFRFQLEADEAEMAKKEKDQRKRKEKERREEKEKEKKENPADKAEMTKKKANPADKTNDKEKDDSTIIQNFLDKNGLRYDPISTDEKDEKMDNLAKADDKMGEGGVEDTDFYKVPFTEALDLVRSRKVYLEKGYAYVPKANLVSIISNCFRTHLSQALALTARSLPYLEEDERLLPRLSSLSHEYLGQGYECKNALPGGKITLDQIDSLSKTSYPLCMRQLHEALRRDHHLKHGGRMQYGLFLKGIGLTLEEALMFWRKEFTRIMEVDKFDKQYAYNIRHSFGKEGKRTDYTPYSCMKIILSNHPGQGDYHGCPFRHSDADILRQKLVAYGVAKSGIEEILKLVKESHYQLACARYFELTHKEYWVRQPSTFALHRSVNGRVGKVVGKSRLYPSIKLMIDTKVSLDHVDAINHPNKYVEESRRVNEGLKEGSMQQEPSGNTSISHVNRRDGIKTEQVTPSSSQKSFTNVKVEPTDGSKGDVTYDMDMDDVSDEGLKDLDELGF